MPRLTNSPSSRGPSSSYSPPKDSIMVSYTLPKNSSSIPWVHMRLTILNPSSPLIPPTPSPSILNTPATGQMPPWEASTISAIATFAVIFLAAGIVVLFCQRRRSPSLTKPDEPDDPADPSLKPETVDN
ncbi:hypothetical protein BC936DRAFT_148700 [Jimgerdemannia flammicorona]|uniref:Uncharacterized protein n=1 Tax=Jimgerdemannia flammicorona TaxID=994334 RepID=A0A433D2F9_9FUNG|nr:hypothetical protein BC936DRAFT_148700 [Jimgerdemannia flammicorona]